MAADKPNITKLAWQQALSDVKLNSPTAMVLTVGGATITLIVTAFISQVVAISAVCALTLLGLMILVIFVWKLFVIPRRLLAEEQEKNATLIALVNAPERSPPAPHDVELFRKFTNLITESDINFFAGHHFGSYIPKVRLNHLREFYEIWDKPQHEFLSHEMNERFNEVKLAAERISNAVMVNTMTSDLRPDCLTVRSDDDPYGLTERTKAEVKEMNDAATQFAEIVTAFHKFGLERGFRFY